MQCLEYKRGGLNLWQTVFTFNRHLQISVNRIQISLIRFTNIYVLEISVIVIQITGNKLYVIYLQISIKTLVDICNKLQISLVQLQISI